MKAGLLFIAQHQGALSAYLDLEDLILSQDAETPPLKGIIFHLGEVTGQFRRTLYFHSVFIGASVLNQILYGIVRDSTIDDPIGAALGVIQSAGIHKPGLIVYPLHSFGLLGVGILEHLSDVKVELLVVEAGIVARAQTNSLDQTIRFIEHAAHSLGINRSVPRDLIEHYSRSRPTKWLTHNPLLVVAARSFSAGYFENQRFLRLQLERASSFLHMLSSLESSIPTRSSQRHFSSLRINNWQTHDIHHFLVLEPRPHSRKSLDSRCVPMNYRAIELAELSSVNVELHPLTWTRRRPIVSRIARALSDIDVGYIRTNIVGTGQRARGRAYRKLMTSLQYFRRSFQHTTGLDDLINMTIAVEVLLTDHYAPDVGNRLRDRSASLLKGEKKRTALVDAIGAVYDARNQAVHTGECTKPVDIPTIREAYIRCLLKIVERVPQLKDDTPDPMTRLSLGAPR